MHAGFAAFVGIYPAHMQDHTPKADPGWPEYLQALMDKSGFRTQAALARASGINDAVISRWLRGEQPGIENLRKLASATGAPMIHLMVASGHLEPEEARMKDRPAPPPAPPLGSGIDPDILTSLSAANDDTLEAIRLMLKATKPK